MSVPPLSWATPSSSTSISTPVRTSLNPHPTAPSSGSISARYHAIAGSGAGAAASAAASASASGSVSARTPGKNYTPQQQQVRAAPGASAARVHLPSVVPASPSSASASSSASGSARGLGARGADTPLASNPNASAGAPSPSLSNSARLRRLRKSFADIDEMHHASSNSSSTGGSGASPASHRQLHPRAPAQGSPLSPLSTVNERGGSSSASAGEHARTSSLITNDMLFNPSTAGQGLGGVTAGGAGLYGSGSGRAPSVVAEEKYGEHSLEAEESEGGRDSVWGDDASSSHAGDTSSQAGDDAGSQGLLLSAAPLLADLHAATKLASAPGSKGDAASGPAAAARAFHPVLTKQSARLERKLRVASSLLAAAAKSCRTTRESKVVSRITQAVEGLGAEESGLLSSFAEELSRAESALVGASTLATSYASLQAKLTALDFDAWSSQSALVDSIQSIERDIVRLGESGVLPNPEYQHALHPVANLVCKKFKRLEELVFLLKRKVAEQARNVKLGNERGANLSLSADSQSPVPSESGGGSGSAARGGPTPGPTSAAPVPVMDENLSAILSEFGSLSGVLRENSSLRRRNAALTRALKTLRAHPGAQAAMQLLSAPERAAINAAVAPSLAASFAPMAGGGSGSSADGMHSLRPAVYSFLSRYDSMWMQMFEAFAEASGGGGTGTGSAVGSTANLIQGLVPSSVPASAAAGAAAAAAGHHAAQATRAARSLTLGELLRWSQHFGLVPSRLSATQLEQLVVLCVGSKEFIVGWDNSAAGKYTNNTLDFFGFKELVARVALTLSPSVAAQRQQGVALPLAGVGLPTQLDRVQTFVYDLDLTMQDQSFGWAGLLGAGSVNARGGSATAGSAVSSSGAVVALLTKQDALLREVFVHYAAVAATPVVEVIQSMAARLTGASDSSSEAATANGGPSSKGNRRTGSVGVIGAEGTLSAGGDAARTSLVWSLDAFMRFAREWGIQEHLLTAQQLLDLFAAAAVSHPLAAPAAGSTQQESRESRQRLLYPEFKLLLARLALVANERYSALDPRALFDAAASSSSKDKHGHASSATSLGEAALLTLSSSMSSLSGGAGGEGFDPSLTIVTQFLDHLGLGGAAGSAEVRSQLRQKLRALREASAAADGEQQFEHKTVEFEPTPQPSQQAADGRAPANAAEAALWNMQEHARRQIRLAGQRERERERDRANGVLDPEAPADLDGAAPSSLPLSSTPAVLSDEATLSQFQDVLSQAFAMYARSTRRVVVGATQVARSGAAGGTVKAIAWSDFLTFAEDFRIVPQLLPHPASIALGAANGVAAASGIAGKSSAATAPPVNLLSMFVSAAVLPAAVAAKKSRASRAAAKAAEEAELLRAGSGSQVASEPEPAPLTYPEFCRLLLRIARAVPTDGYRAAEGAEPTTVFLEHIAQRFVFDWHEAADVVQRSLGAFVPSATGVGSGSAVATQRKASAARETFDRDLSFAHDPLRAPTIADLPEGDDDGGDFYRSASPQPQQHQTLSANIFMDPTEEELQMQAGEDSSDEEQVPPSRRGAKQQQPLVVSLPSPVSPSRTVNSADGLESPSSAYASVSAPEVTFAWIKPDAVRHGSSAAILARIRAEGFEILASQLRHLDPLEIDAFYAEHTGQPWYGGLKSFLLSGPSRALALRKPNAIAEWRKLMGPTNSIKARAEAPSSLRALFGTDGQRNATHGSDSAESAARELQLVFSHFASVPGSPNASLRDQVPVFVLVKPDAVAAGHVAPILARFEAESRSIRVLSASRAELTLTAAQVEALYRVHPLKLQAAACAAQLADLDAQRQGRSSACGATSPSGGLSTVAYNQRSKQLLAQLQILDQNWAAFRAFMSSGPVVAFAMHVAAPFVKSGALANLVGPTDPALAKSAAPQSLRAQFGSSLYRNAVHMCVGIGAALPQALKEMRDLLSGFTPTMQTTLVILKPNLAADSKAVSALLMRLRAAPGLEIERTVSLPIREDVRKIAFAKEQAVELFGAGATAADAAAGAAVSEAAAAGVAGGSDSSPSQTEAVSSLLSNEHPSYVFRVRGLDAVRSLRLFFSSGASGLSAQECAAGVHVSQSLEAALREVRLVFDQYRDSIQTTLALIKPDAVASGYSRRIMDRALAEGFEILRVEECLRLTEAHVRELYADQQSQSYFPLLCKFMTSGPLVALALRRENAVEAWREVVGSPELKTSLRGELATDSTRNAVHGSASLAAAARELDLIFTRLAPLEQSTFGMLKPGVAGSPAEDAILARIAEQGFDIVRMERVERLSSLQIRRLFAAHKHTWQQAPPVVEKIPGAKPVAATPSYLPSASGQGQPSFEEFSNYMSSGPVLGLHLRRAQAVRTFKQLVGGSTMEALVDPARARAEAPACLRAEFGKDLLRNALHASASLDDARRELGLFFASAAFYPPPQSTLLLLKPNLIAAGHTDAVVRRVAAQGFEILRQKKMQLSAAQVQQLFGTKTPAGSGSAAEALPSLDLDAGSGMVDSLAVDPELVSMLSSSPVIALHVSKPDAVVQMQKLCGVIAPAAAASTANAATSDVSAASSSVGSSSADAPSASDPDAPLFLASTLEHLKAAQPSTLRALYATDASALGDGVYCSTSVLGAERELDQLFHEWFPEAAQFTLVLLKPDLYAAVGSGTEAGRAAQMRVDQIMSRLAEEGFEIVRKSKVRLSESQVRLLYAEHKGRIFLPALVSFMSSGACLAMELRRIDGVKHWRRVIGPTDPARARTEAPNSLRAQYGSDGLRNGLHGSSSPAKAARELSLVFEQFVSLIEETCVLLKPEVIASGQSHAMRRAIQSAGFEILKTEKMTLTTQQAMRFYAEHAGAGYFTDLVSYMCSGPVVALLLRKENAIADFRTLMGCTDSSLARRTAPNSLRALFGRDKKRNGVHGSESKESAAREIAMVFRDFSVGVQDTFAFIKPDAFAHAAAIIARLVEEGFAVRTQIVRTLSANQAKLFYEEHSSAPFFQALVNYMSSGPVVGLVLRKENAVRALRELAGPTNSLDAKQSDPESLRALWGTDGLRNAIHASKSLEAARRELSLVFNSFFVGVQTTTVLITPDSVAKQYEAAILAAFRNAGFEIVRKKALSLTQEQARVYLQAESDSAASAAASGPRSPSASQPVDPLFDQRVAFISSGPSLALELRREDAVKVALDLLGRGTPEIARSQNPQSIRALYGSSAVQCAAIVSASVDASARECALLFDTFSSSLLTTLAILKPDVVKRGQDEAILARLTGVEGFELLAQKRLKLSTAQAKALYAADAGKSFFKAAVEFISSGTLVCLALRKNSALSELQKVCGDANPKVAKKLNPNSLRALYGTTSNQNAIHCPESLSANAREMSLLFDEYNFDLLG